jgi:hypothetical protein
MESRTSAAKAVPRTESGFHLEGAPDGSLGDLGETQIPFGNDKQRWNGKQRKLRLRENRFEGNRSGAAADEAFAARLKPCP